MSDRKRSPSPAEGMLASVYRPDAVEGKWYDIWMKRQAFRARAGSGKPPFSVVIPPPNVTGSLHMGHALNNTLQDVLVRWRRMQGYETLWLPGTDHAGIATQHVVDEQLANEGLDRHAIGRDEFIKRVWEWKGLYGGTIINQLKRLGASCDWSRERFTMDEGCSRAVREVFVSLYEKGLIYRGSYIINWCPECLTALSDIEVEHEETEGTLWYVKYPLDEVAGMSREYITVATTRPETILGDTAVAVHPEDERYTHLVGRRALVPGVNRWVPVIADSFVDREFGTGAVKITPAHDPDDFHVGQRHGLPSVTVIGEDGIMTSEAGPYAGMSREKCREALLADLERQGLLVKAEKIAHAVGHCYRCDSVVEPLLSKQWFVKMAPLAEPAIKEVVEGRIRFIPERFTKVYINWLENIRDWCISRQIWWGHRIPAWYCAECGETVVARTEPEVCPRCGSRKLNQDPDVLDTWFSSALWPFSTMGWPDDTEDLRHFYPTSLLVTGYDIIFFWVARMIFMALEFTGKKPFSDVLINGLVRDALGRKMSKSLGNGIDPVEVIDKHGADALRLTLVTGNTPGNDMRFSWEKVEASRNFCNKIWNAARFVQMNLHAQDDAGGTVAVPTNRGFHVPQGEAARNLHFTTRWILSRFARCAEKVTQELEEYQIGEAARALYDFIWDEYCDWYIELSKVDIKNGRREEALSALVYVLDGTMRLLHPFMPFISEEIWQGIRKRLGVGAGDDDDQLLTTASWPANISHLIDDESERIVAFLMEVVRATRNLRAEVGVPPSQEVDLIVSSSAERRALLERLLPYVKSLARVQGVRFVAPDAPKPRNVLTAVVTEGEIFLPFEGLIDIDRELERLGQKLSEEMQTLERSALKLQNPEFLEKAPPAVIEKERERKEQAEERVARLERRISLLRGAASGRASE